MRFREGMLGITVVMVAIALGLLGSWALSTDVNDTEITVYNELTEITPLFGSENAPSYTTYNPSSNYTGYYTDDSIINGVQYFDGVDYTASNRANIYRLDLAPTSSTYADSYSLTDITPSATHIINYWAVNDTVTASHGTKDISLTDLISALNLSSYNRFVIKNPTSPDYSEEGTFITFCKSTDLTGGKEFKNPNLTGELVVESWMTMPAEDAADIILAIDYDTRSGQVNTYYDVDMTQKAGIVSPDQVHLLWGGGSYPSAFYFGDSIDYIAYMMPGATYLDPSKGVELE